MKSKAMGYPVLFAISVCDILRCLKVIISLTESHLNYKLKTFINFRNYPMPKNTTEHTIMNY
jgi:hypothetical protein